jgi:hypothetical protein
MHQSSQTFYACILIVPAIPICGEMSLFSAEKSVLHQSFTSYCAKTKPIALVLSIGCFRNMFLHLELCLCSINEKHIAPTANLGTGGAIRTRGLDGVFNRGFGNREQGVAFRACYPGMAFCQRRIFQAQFASSRISSPSKLHRKLSDMGKRTALDLGARPGRRYRTARTFGQLAFG